jgi:putative Holliday junction resolvase
MQTNPMEGRYMAFDYGTKRIGLAVTDPFRIIATGLETLHPNYILSFLSQYTKTETVSLFIVGMPLQMDNSPSEITPHVEGFVKLLKKNFPNTPLVRMDERFTSKMAHRIIQESGLKKKSRQNKETIDKISATLILQSYLEWESRENR